MSSHCSLHCVDLSAVLIRSEEEVGEAFHSGSARGSSPSASTDTGSSAPPDQRRKRRGTARWHSGSAHGLATAARCPCQPAWAPSMRRRSKLGSSVPIEPLFISAIDSLLPSHSLSSLRAPRISTRAASHGYGEEREYAGMHIVEATTNFTSPDAEDIGSPTVVTWCLRMQGSIEALLERANDFD
jgi:hypothetical protein